MVYQTLSNQPPSYLFPKGDYWDEPATIGYWFTSKDPIFGIPFLKVEVANKNTSSPRMRMFQTCLAEDNTDNTGFELFKQAFDHLIPLGCC